MPTPRRAPSNVRQPLVGDNDAHSRRNPDPQWLEIGSTGSGDSGCNGIGRAIADMLISHGARVHICDVADEALADFAEANPNHGLTKADVIRMFEDVKHGLGGLDALINNAGIAGPTGGVEEISPADWRRCIDVSLTGQFLCTHYAVPLIKAQSGGAIVNMSSVAGRHGYPFRSAYSAAKFGVIGFTQSLAKELGPQNIRVNAILTAHDYPWTFDGSTVDAEGYIWNAHVFGGRIARYAPDGTLDRMIEFPVRNLTSLMFGGKNLDVLYVTSMSRPVKGVRQTEAEAGGLFAVHGLGVKGLPEPRFGAEVNETQSYDLIKNPL